MDTTRAQIGRMKEALGVKKNTELADILDIARNQISLWPARKKIPEKYLWKASTLSGYTVSWLETGEGEMKPGQSSNLPLEMIERIKEQMGEYQTPGQPVSTDLALLNQLYPLLDSEQQKTLLVQAAGWALAKLNS